jgi:hypothetical protein
MKIKTLILLIFSITLLTSCSLSMDPVKRYCVGFSTSGNDPWKNVELINSAIDMMKQNPEKSVFGGSGFLYKDWVEFHELIFKSDISLDEKKQVSKLLGDFCSDVLK